MTTRESFGISKVILNELLPALSINPSDACKYFAHDASFIWAAGQSQSLIVGKHSIYEFLQQMPLFNFEIKAYDAHSIPSDPAITSLVVTGIITFSPQESHEFHITSHITEIDNGRSALVRTFTMKID